MFKTYFCFQNRSSIKSAWPEKIHWPLRIEWLKNDRKIYNIADRLPEDSRNSFVDLHSQNSKKDRPKKIRLFIEGRYVIFRLKIYKFLLPLLAALK